MVQGALSTVKVNSYDPVTIQNGTQGMKRIDLICWQYTYDAEQDVESAEWVVIQGTPAETDPQQPAYTDGDIQQGDSPVQVPVFAVELDGINVTGVTTLLPTAPTFEELNDKLDEKIIVQRYSNRINVSNGQNSYTAINVNIPDGYTIIGISTYAIHATTLCGGGAYDSNNNRIVIPFSAHDSVTPETFHVDLTLMVE